MFTVFNFIGSIFGYILWAVFWVFQNFGIAIIVFTLIFRAILFPSSIKQQKSMAANASLQAKQRDIKEKYGNNKAKYNEEIQKLYAKEGVSPMSGCATSLFPMIIMLGIYYAVVRPLSNVIHLSSQVINQLNMIPGVYMTQNNIYSEMNALKLFTNPDNIAMLTQQGLPAKELSEIHNLAGGFNFLGLDLLSIPQTKGFTSAIIIIPILCLVTSLGSQILTTRLNGNPMQNQQGCMKYMLYLLPLITVYISYIVPGAVGFYWTWSTIFGFVQTVLISKFYSAAHMNAKAEAEHIALMELKEAKVPYDYQPVSQPQLNTTNNSKKK
ncbi:MAG: membrane protein insertase YidC [Ruminococcus sp.]|nr:membrane protein insertase YidC [Ruminococcus sp.]